VAKSLCRIILVAFEEEENQNRDLRPRARDEFYY